SLDHENVKRVQRTAEPVIARAIEPPAPEATTVLQMPAAWPQLPLRDHAPPAAQQLTGLIAQVERAARTLLTALAELDGDPGSKPVQEHPAWRALAQALAAAAPPREASKQIDAKLAARWLESVDRFRDAYARFSVRRADDGEPARGRNRLVG